MPIGPKMILSESNQFVFIKGRKVAGTSVEVGLTSLCNYQDILTPITPIDEVTRFRETGLMAQNYGANPSKFEAYQKLIQQIATGSKQDCTKTIKPIWGPLLYLEAQVTSRASTPACR